ncbi:MAG: EamA family transporter [Gemmatimonadetes bacterium]|nr:EamA family transporter [Gemmatimonadota bacterium]
MTDQSPPAGAGRHTAADSPLLVHGVLLTVALLFGANYVVAKFAIRELTPLALVVLRTSGTAAILFAVSALTPRRRGSQQFTRSEFRELFLYSLLGASINQICFLEGLSRTTATNAAVMFVCVPLMTLGFAVMLGREKATWNGVTGIVIGLVGALILIVPEGDLDFSSSATFGNILLLIGGAAFGLYLVLTRPILARHDPLRVMSWVFLFSALTVLPFGIGGIIKLGSTGMSNVGWASAAYVVVGATVFPYLLNSWALVRVTASVVAVYILLQPVVAGTLGRIFLGESFGPNTALAATLVVVGVLISTWRPNR